jgi:ATP-dependent Clp protease ATP-binding subunit ClpA
MDANAVYPEHLLLGVIAQGESKAAKQLCFAGMDMPALRTRATEFFNSHYINAPSGELAFSSDAQECLRQSIEVAEQVKAPLVLPEHVVLSVVMLGVLDYGSMQAFFTPFNSSLDRLIAELSEEVRGVQDKSPRQKVMEALQPYATPLPVNRPRLCPSCNREARPNWKHCVFCGSALERLCPKCGTPQAQIEGARFCFACGSQLA